MALQGFDKEYYLAAKLAALQADPAYATDWATKTTTDLEAFLKIEGFTPESHYQAYGWAEGLAPNALFNAAEYKQAKFEALVADGEYDTVAEAEAAFDEAWPFNPYLHYVQYGSAEGINPSNAFDESEYLASKLADLKTDPDTATEWADKTVDDVKDAFAAAGLSALGHYQAYGEDEGIAVTEVPADEKVADDGGEEVPGETFTLTTSADSVDEGGSVDFTLANGEANTEYAYKVTGDGAAAQVAAVTTDADGNATISVDASDVLSTDQAITVSIIGEDLTSTVTAVAVNDAPALTDAAATLADGVEDTAYTVDAADLLAGYTDEEGDAMSVANLTADNDAEVVDNGDGSFTINPVADFNGTVTLSYDVTDGTDATAATQAVVFAAVNDAPTTTAATAAATEAGAAVEGQLEAADVDGDELTFSLDAAVEGLTLNADGSYSFDPSANTAVQALTYTDEPLDVVADYTVDDGNGETVQSTLTVTVDPTPLTFSLVETESFVKEGSTVTYTIEASEAVQSEFTGEVQLTAGDGSQGQTDISDFGAGSFNPQIVTIAEGDTTSTVAEITPLDDGETEYPESYTVEATIDGYTIESIEGEVRDTPDKTFTLTTGVDEFTGGAGNDTFTGVIDGTIGAVATTLTALDSLDGGDGQDVFNLNVLNGSGVAGTAVTALPTGVTVANIETLKLASAVDLTANTSTWTDVENVNVTQVAGDLDLTVDSASAVDVAGVTGLTEITNGSSVNVSQKIGDGANIANAKDITVDVTNSAAAADANDDGTPGDGVLITGATGVVDVNVTGQKLSGDDGATKTDSVSVTGGTSVNVTQVAASSFGDAATKNAGGNDVVTQGAVTIDATADTTTVDVKQDAAVSAKNAANTTGGVTETASVKFGAIKAGDTLTLDPDQTGGAADLVFTAAEDMTADDVAAAFANLEDGDTQSASLYKDGTYTGNLTGWTSAAANGDTVVFTSTTANTNVADLAITLGGGAAGTAPVVTTTAGKAHDATPAGGVTGVVAGTVDITNGTALTSVTVDGFSVAGSNINGANTVLDTLNLSNGGAFTTSNAADTLDLSLEGINGNYTQTAGATTLNVTSTGDNTADLIVAKTETLTIDGTGVITANGGASNVSGAKTITVTGSAGINLGTAGATTALTSVDTSGTTGTVTMGIDDGTATSYTGGAGVDNLTIENADTAVSKAISLGGGNDKLTLVGASATVAVPTVTLDGGADTDTLSTDAASAAALDGDTTFASKLTGFERLEITGTTGAQAVNVANLGFADYVTVAGVVGGGTLTLNDLANNANVVLNAAATGGGLTTVIKDAGDATLGTDDTLNLEVTNENTIAAGTLTAADIETVNLTVTDVFTDTNDDDIDDNDATHTMTFKADTATELNIDGSAGLTLTLDAATVNLETINASAMTDGGLTVTADGNNVMTITGGDGADVLTASAAKADVIDGGAGNDTLTAGFNGALLTGGAGNDLFVVGADSATGNQEANTYSKILDFQAGDKIQLAYWETDTSAGGSGASTDAVDSFAKLNASLDESTASFSNFVDAAFQEMTSVGDAIWFMYGGDSYIAIDSNEDAGGAAYTAQAGFTDGEDLIVRVEDVDLTGVSFNSDHGTIEIA